MASDLQLFFNVIKNEFIFPNQCHYFCIITQPAQKEIKDKTNKLTKLYFSFKTSELYKYHQRKESNNK